MNTLIPDIILTAVAVIWLIAASVTDIKKREVADWLSYSLIAIALATRGLFAIIFQNSGYFLYGLLGFGIFIIISLIFYYTRIFGGGDAKLLMGLGACFGTTPGFVLQNVNMSTILPISSEPFLLTLFINILFLGSIYGIIFAIIVSIKNKKRFSKLFKKNQNKTKIFYFILAFVILILALFTKMYEIIIFVIILIILPYIFTIVRVSEKLMITKKPWNKLTEGDWISEKIKIGSKIIKPNADGLSKKDILLIKKANKKILVKDGIPFVPAILISLIITLILGNLLFLILI